MSAVPSVEDLVKNFLDGGWETLSGAADRSDAERRARADKQKRIADDVLWLAHNPQGRRVLEFILDQSIRRASWHGDLRLSLEQTATYGLLREGQNSIAAMLIAALRQATGGDASILSQPKGADHGRRFERWNWRRWRGWRRG